jgi:hypothetical protein
MFQLALRRSLLAAVFSISALAAAPAIPPDRWALADDGGITWNVKPGEVHQDNMEMSGLRVSTIVSYGVDTTGHFTVSRQVIWPMLRFQPNKTRDHLALTFGEDAAPRVFINQAAPRNESITRVHLKGTITVEGTLGPKKDIAFTRLIFPSTDKPAVFDQTTYTNHSAENVVVEVEDNRRVVHTNAGRGIYGAYTATAEIIGGGEHTLKPGDSITFTSVFAARKDSEPPPSFDVAAELAARRERVESFLGRLQLQTPDPVLNTAFAFAKIRAAESIFATKGGLMHAPGGGAYYAAIWANDQAEYANPYFGYFGDNIAVESAINAYRHFARFMNPEYRPIPSSIIAEGESFWNGAKDRGDMAMIAYGASRFALAYGNKETARELWPLISWCLEYCRRKVTADGVVASDSDELENRFPSGKANLCTSSLYYDALQSAALLGAELGEPADGLTRYREQATAVRAAIERYFGAKVEGFDTYRYFDKRDPGVPRHAAYANKPDLLRAWICIPLTVGIYDRAPATIAALFSPRLWTPDGLATQAGEITFWDRSTLYALRGVFAAGDTQRALDYLTYYSHRRLLGDHVPYPVEAYPEGNQRHLSAESALYCRIYTEGVFGLRPTGLRSFTLTPRLPAGWPSMAIHQIHAFGQQFDLSVTRSAGKLSVAVARAGQATQIYAVDEGGTVAVNLANAP